MEEIFQGMVEAGGGKIVSTPTEGQNNEANPFVDTVLGSGQQPVESPKNEPAEPSFSYELFGKTFGGEWDEERLKSALDRSSKYEDVLKEKTEHEKRIMELEAIEKTDPLKFFSSKDAYLREQFLLKNKDIDQNVLNVFSNLSPQKIDKLSDFEVVKTKMLVDNPDIEGGEQGVVELLCDKFSLTPEELSDYDSLDALAKNKIKIEAKSAKKELKSMYDGIEMPKMADVSTSRQEIRSKWESPLKEVINGIDKLQLAEGYEFPITDDMKQGLYDEQLSKLGNHLVEPNEENLRLTAGDLRTEILKRNLDKIVKSLHKDIEEKVRAEVRAEVHNTKPLNNDARDTVTSKTFEDFLQTI